MWTSWRSRRPPSSARASPTTRGSSRARARPSPPSSSTTRRASGSSGARASAWTTSTSRRAPAGASWSATRRTATSSPPPSTRSACSWRWCAASPRRTRGSRPWSGIGGSTAPSSTVRLSASSGSARSARVSRCACAGSRRTWSCTIRTFPRAARRTSAPGRWTSRRSCARPTSSPSTCRSRPRPRTWWPRASSHVWSEEPPAGEPLRRLIQHPRVVVTPHLGANSGEAQVNVAVDVARQLVAFRAGGLVEHAVNIPLGDPTAVAALRPFVALADRLGRFTVQLDPEPLGRLEVTLAGALAEADPELLARAVLAGLLAPVMAGPVNLVNARLVAEERGVEVHVGREAETSGYKSVLTITTSTRGGRKIIAGTVFDGQPRIVRLRDLDIEFTPEGHILVLSYEDRPGMVGKIGSILGRQNVNIASMHVGRREKRGRAIVVLILDEDLVPEQLREVARAVEADFARLIRVP